MSRASDEHLAAARAAAARMAATAVLAGRSAATAARSRNSCLAAPSCSSFRNDAANRAMAAAALRAAAQPTADEVTLQNCRDASDAGGPCATNVSHADRPGDARAAHKLDAQRPRRVGKDLVATDSERDDAKICEWDIKVQRTFITVVPLRKQLTHTVAWLSFAFSDLTSWAPHSGKSSAYCQCLLVSRLSYSGGPHASYLQLPKPS